MGGCRYVFVLLATCRAPVISFENRLCDTDGRCLPGYVCDVPSNRCVRDSSVGGGGDGSGGLSDLHAAEGDGSARLTFTAPGACQITTADMTVLDITEAGPVDHTFTGLTDGVAVTFVVTCGGQATSVTVTPIGPPTNVVAQGGLDGQVVLSWTQPAGATSCIARRAGVAVATPELGLTNGTAYTYEVACKSGDPYPSGGVTVTATPIGLVQDLAVTQTAPTTASLTFTRPAGAVACKVMRDGTQVGAEVVDASPVVVDAGLTIDATYSYAIFCRADDTYRNTTVQNGHNGATVTMSDCIGTVTVSRFVPTVAQIQDCHLADPQNPEIMRLVVTTANCPATLTSLKLTEHPSSTVLPYRMQLWLDNNDGALNQTNDSLLAIVSAPGTAVTFSGFAQTIPANQAATLLVTGGTGPTGYMAWTIMDPADVTVAQTGRTTVLSPSPLIGDAHALRGKSCHGFVRGVDSVISYEADLSSGDFTAADPVDVLTYCAANLKRCDFAGLSTDDCAVADSLLADDLAVRTDGGVGATGRYLHIDTGVPIGLPVCGFHMMLHATDSDVGTGACHNALFAQAPVQKFMRYTDATNVTANPTFVTMTPVSLSGACNNDSVDHDLIDLYGGNDLAAAAETFNVRFIATAASGATGPLIQDVTEITVRITAQ